MLDSEDDAVDESARGSQRNAASTPAVSNQPTSDHFLHCAGNTNVQPQVVASQQVQPGLETVVDLCSC